MPAPDQIAAAASRTARLGTSRCYVELALIECRIAEGLQKLRGVCWCLLLLLLASVAELCVCVCLKTDLASALEVDSSRMLQDLAFEAQLLKAAQQLASAAKSTTTARINCAPQSDNCGSRQLAVCGYCL